MEKTRKIWWIVGGFALLLFGIVAWLTVATSGVDADLGRQVARIADKYGFDARGQRREYFDNGMAIQSFDGDILTDKEFDQVAADLHDIFPDFRATYTPGSPTAPPGLILIPTDEYRYVDTIMLAGSRQSSPGSPMQPGPTSILILSTRKPSPLDKLRSWLPW